MRSDISWGMMRIDDGGGERLDAGDFGCGQIWRKADMALQWVTEEEGLRREQVDSAVC